VQEAVEKGTVREKAKPGAPKLIVEEAGNVGRRKQLAGKEGSINVQMSDSSGDKVSAVSENEARQLLTRFQFPSKRWFDRIGQLSGGERRRLQLLQILAKKPNVLLLDEVSNDLDLATIAALEEFLLEVFEGCLVIVSHDNYFVNRVCEKLFVFEGDGVVREFQGSYTDYLNYRRDSADEKRKEAQAAKKDSASSSKASSSSSSSTTAAKKSSSSSPSPSPSPSPSSSSPPSRTLTFNERKEYNKLEKEIAKLNGEIDKIEAQINGSDGTEGYTVLNEWTATANKLKEQLAGKEVRWLELAEFA